MPGEEALDGLVVAPHVRVIRIAEQPHRETRGGMQFELEVVRVRAGDVPVHVDAVGDSRHQRFAKAQGPTRRVVFDDGGVRVASSVCGVVERTVVVDCPIGELQVAVAADRVDVEEIGHAKLAGADLDAAQGNVRGERQGRGSGVGDLRAERNRHVHQGACDVRRRAERRVPDDVQVRKSRQPEGVAEAAPAGALDIEEQLRVTG